MGQVRDPDLRDLKFPLGADNTTPEHELPPGAAREAVNLEFNDVGGFRSRTGATKLLALDEPHSLFAHEDFPYMALRSGEWLNLIDPGLDVEQMIGGLGEDEASYCVLNGELLWTVEGRRTGRIDSMMLTRPLGLPTPPGVPSAIPAALGGMDAGTYEVALAYQSDDGELSGLCEPVSVTLAEGQSIAVTLPALAMGAALTRVYVSHADGKVLYHAATAAGGMVTITAGMRGDAGAELQGLHPLPAGHILRELNGVLWMASGKWLLHGVPMRPFLARPGTNDVGFPYRIDMLEPVGDGEDAGLFVAAGKRTYFLAGGIPGKQSQSMLRGHGAVPHSGCTLDGEPFGVNGAVAAWMGTDGVPCLGLPGGSVRKLAERMRMPNGMEAAAMLLREHNGIKNLLLAGRGGQVSTFAATDEAEVFHYRDGVKIN